MATVAHSSLTGSNLHEPKGIAAAVLDKVCVSDGAGSGAWQYIEIEQIDSADLSLIGTWVLLETETAASSSTLDFTTIGSTYDNYELRISNLKVSADDTEVRIRVGTGGGPTYATTSYMYSTNYSSSTTAADDDQGTSASFIKMGNDIATRSVGNATGENLCGVIRFSNPDASDFMIIEYSAAYINSAGDVARLNGSGCYNVAGAVTAIRLYPETGTFASGVVRLWGLRNS